MPDKDANDVPVLTGHFDAPLPGVYYMTLTMTAGAGASQIDYSKSFWVSYEAKTGGQVTGKVNQNTFVNAPYLPKAWRKVSNADVPDVEELALTIDKKSVEITPSDLATFDFNEEELFLHCEKKDKGKLSFDVTTEYGDRWTLNYDFVID